MATATKPKAPKKRTAAEWEALARLALHPMKIEILDMLRASKDPLSPSKISEQTNERLGNVSYHVRDLLKRGLIRETHTEPRRGAVEHFYELT